MANKGDIVSINLTVINATDQNNVQCQVGGPWGPVVLLPGSLIDNLKTNINFQDPEPVEPSP